MKGRITWLFFPFLFSLFLVAQDNEECEACHDDDTLETVKYGITYSLYVTTDHLANSPHEDFNCIDCHQDLEGFDDFPHASRLILPDCGTCHEDAQEAFIDGFFAPLKKLGYSSLPTCADCHGTHEVSWKGEPRQVCGVCHKDILGDFLEGAHWHEETQTADVTCVSCHSPHNKHERLEYSKHEWRLHLAESCRKCHAENVENYFLSGHYTQLKAGNLKAPVCSDCHAKHRVLSPRDPDSRVSVAKLDLVCTQCHAGYEASIHRPEEFDDARLITCVVCHTGHETEMVGTSKTSVFDIELDQVCLRCHSETLITGLADAHGAIHRSELEKIERGEASNCGDCHTYHFMAPDHKADTALEKSCGDCHPEEEKQYLNSSHNIARKKGHKEAPTCVTCHTNRRIQKSEEEFFGHSIIDLCSGCHGDRNLTMKFQLNTHVVEGYNSSYHGQMYQLGYQGEEFATCISCHDNHSILPSNDPRSSISKGHIIETCGQCHDNVNANFVKYLQHYSPMVKEENLVLHLIHTFMVWLLGVTLTIFGGHTILWFIRLMIKRIKEGPIKKTPKTGKRVKRFNAFERIMHLGVITSFLTLSITGLPLKYSHSEWSNWFVNNLLGFRTAALLHRTAAVILFTVFFFHLMNLLYKVMLKKQKGIFWGPDSLVPNLQDAKDFVAHMAYFIGLRKKEPAFGRWTYWEKFDYFAVFWGMIVIGASGLTLWFPETFSRAFPGWLINAAHIIHSEEALLATAFIFTVHFFNTHLRPGAFPMDEVMFTGRITEEIFEEERSLQKEALSKEEYEAILINPSPKWLKRLTFLAGYTFLAIGVISLVLIILGTFFQG